MTILRSPGRVAACVFALLVLAPGAALAGNRSIRINEVLAGVNGDSTIQFIEIAVSNGDNEWAPQSGGSSYSRAMLQFFDGAGYLTNTYEFTSDPATGSGLVLIATQPFLDAYAPSNPGLADIVLPGPYVVGVDGMVCFRDNPANDDPGKEAVNFCVSYGDFQGGEESDGCPAPTMTGPPAAPRVPMSNDRGLPIAVDENAVSNAFPLSLTNTATSYHCYSSGNSDFTLMRPTPTSTAGGSVSASAFVAAANTEQGQKLFALETFDGNGRTCQTCHQPVDGFGLSPTTIANLFNDDPNGPLFAAPAIEDDCLMRTNPRGLILENIDTFASPPVFRSTPHLIAIANSAPYGMGFCPGPSCTPTPKVVDNLSDFCLGAIEQHFPLTTARNSDPAVSPLDFRSPTDFELAAMEDFQEGIDFPEKPFIGATGLETANNLIAEFLLRNPTADSVSIMNGRDRFFGIGGVVADAKCAQCHDGPVLDRGPFTVPTGLGIPDHFDVGTGSDGTTSTITNPIAANRDTGCSGGVPTMPGDPLAAEGSGGSREFNTMPLVGIANTAPFFHDGSATDMTAAVGHYGIPAFNNSPAGVAIGGIVLGPVARTDLVNFMNALTVPEPSARVLHAAAVAALVLDRPAKASRARRLTASERNSSRNSSDQQRRRNRATLASVPIAANAAIVADGSGTKLTVSCGRKAGSGRTLSRVASAIGKPVAWISQPKLVAGVSTHDCTSCAMATEFQVIGTPATFRRLALALEAAPVQAVKGRHVPPSWLHLAEALGVAALKKRCNHVASFCFATSLTPGPPEGTGANR